MPIHLLTDMSVQMSVQAIVESIQRIYDAARPHPRFATLLLQDGRPLHEAFDAENVRLQDLQAVIDLASENGYFQEA